MPRGSDFGYFEIALRGEERDYPALADISAFLYDFNLLYEFSRVIVDPKYAEYKFSRLSTFRNAKRIEADDRLEVEALRLESPIELLTIVIAMPAAAAALWALTQTIEKIANFPINREILTLQRDKLRTERHSASPSQAALTASDASFREQLRIREAGYLYNRMEKRLHDNPVRIRELEITHIRDLSSRKKGRQ